MKNFQKPAAPELNSLAATGVKSGTNQTKWLVVGICLLLTMLISVVYAQTLSHEFVNYDDASYVYENPIVIQGLTLDGIIKAFTYKEMGLWNPLVTISHMLDCQLYGLWAGGHHLTNVLLHLASVLLLFLILRKMTGALWASAFVAALFGIHPLRVESVAWIAERKDVLSGFFFMLTLAAYIHYIHRTESWGRYLIVLSLFVCGLMSKAMLVTLPFLLLLLDYWPLNRLFKNSKPGSHSALWFDVNVKIVKEKLPFILLSLGLCLTILLGSKESDLGSPEPSDIEPIAFAIRLGLAPVWLLIYLGQMIWPFGLALIYPRPENYFPWWPAALFLCISISLAIFVLRKKHPYLWMGWLWNLGMLVPVLGIIQISRHSQADHYTYLPQIGLYLGGVWVLAAWIEKRPPHRRMAAAGAVAVLGLLLCASYRQTSLWRDNVKLWNHTLSCTSSNYVAHYNLGFALYQQGKAEEGLSNILAALQINPDYAPAHNRLGGILLQQGKIEEAVSAYHNVLRINPAHAGALNNLGLALLQQGKTDDAIVLFDKALQIYSSYADAYNNRGLALFQQGKTEKAIIAYQKALQINPAYVRAHTNLGLALFQQGKMEMAIASYRNALKINPTDANTQNNLGLALYQRGKTEEAIAAYRNALQLNFSYAEAHNNLGAALFQQGKTEEAITHIQEALKNDSSFADAHNNLGKAFYLYGKIPEAISAYRRALQINPALPDAHHNLGLALFQQGKIEEALFHLRESLRINPSYAKVHDSLGVALYHQGKIKEAIIHFRKALELQPHSLELQNKLAWVLATTSETSLRNGAQAIQLATQANQSSGGNNVLILRTLAAAYAEGGQFSNAVQTAQKALQLAQTSNNTSAAKGLLNDIKLYHKNRPIRASQ